MSAYNEDREKFLKNEGREKHARLVAEFEANGGRIQSAAPSTRPAEETLAHAGQTYYLARVLWRSPELVEEKPRASKRNPTNYGHMIKIQPLEREGSPVYIMGKKEFSAHMEEGGVYSFYTQHHKSHCFTTILRICGDGVPGIIAIHMASPALPQAQPAPAIAKPPVEPN